MIKEAQAQGDAAPKRKRKIPKRKQVKAAK
jgi:hypothetical protein